MRIRGESPARGEEMKIIWILIALLPIAAVGAECDEDLFYVAGESDQIVSHIGFDAEEDYEKNLSEAMGSIEIEYEYDSGLSLLEIDERDESLLPWAIEGFAGEDISSYVDRKAKEVTEEFEDVFAFEIPSRGTDNVFEPTFERVPEEKRSLFGRPRVVPSKEDKQQETASQQDDAEREKNTSPKTAPPKKQLIIKG
ncbi:MAG: hypothetical protein KR126chlam3_01352 [Chlamydiae bacterium]|nr:hypothetical protein [Chlamydiota bacterium]